MQRRLATIASLRTSTRLRPIGTLTSSVTSCAWEWPPSGGRFFIRRNNRPAAVLLGALPIRRWRARDQAFPMYIICLATDYDGTLAHDGEVDGPTVGALEEFRRTGRKLILATGRELPDIERVFSRLDLFDRVVAENGALLFDPATKKETPLAPPPPGKFVAAGARAAFSWPVDRGDLGT
jgi:haloacid dehalogenase-like hydrolase